MNVLPEVIKELVDSGRETIELETTGFPQLLALPAVLFHLQVVELNSGSCDEQKVLQPGQVLDWKVSNIGNELYIGEKEAGQISGVDVTPLEHGLKGRMPYFSS